MKKSVIAGVIFVCALPAIAQMGIAENGKKRDASVHGAGSLGCPNRRHLRVSQDHPAASSGEGYSIVESLAARLERPKVHLA